MRRIATAIVLLLALWAATFPAPFPVFVAVAALGIAAACWEGYRLLRHRGDRPFSVVGILVSWGLVWAFSGLEPRFEVLLPLLAGIILVPGLAMARRDEPIEMLAATRSTLFPIAFVALPLSFLVGLRAFGEQGKWLLVLLFLVVALGDTMAFYVGSLVGRHRMAPTISPKKTWEGAAGGLVFGVAGSLAFATWIVPEIPLHHAAILGLLLAVAGMVGDLAESMLKRAIGVKDSSNLLPGHGGLLDRTDSLLFTAPILYYYYSYFLQGVW